MTRIAAVVLAAALAFSACGSDQVGVAEAAVLLPRVDAVEAAVAAGDHAGARRELAALRQAVQQRFDAGELRPGAAREILDAADRVEAELGAVVVTVPVTVPPRVVVVPSGGGKSGDDDKGDDRDGKGKGRGKAKDDD